MRYQKFVHSLSDAIAQHEPTALAYELVRAHKGTQAAHVYGGFVAHLQVVAELSGNLALICMAGLLAARSVVEAGDTVPLGGSRGGEMEGWGFKGTSK